ncbi:hypothetical protein QJS66_11670 [Kocuria rhizophila]|nr:hypothetical protein QJS66_11670 [Kocuria rhizophila]
MELTLDGAAEGGLQRARGSQRLHRGRGPKTGEIKAMVSRKSYHVNAVLPQHDEVVAAADQLSRGSGPAPSS